MKELGQAALGTILKEGGSYQGGCKKTRFGGKKALSL